MMNRRIILVSLALATFVCFTAATYAITSATFTVYRPWTAQMRVSSSTVTVTGLQFTLNDSTHRYDAATLYLTNTGNIDADVTISIRLHTQGNITIAESSISTTLKSNISNITTPLTWVENYTVFNMTGGRITVNQQPSGG